MIDPKTRDAYAKRVGSLCSDCSVLTASVLSDINQVFYGEGPTGDLSATDLSIRYVTGQEYHDLVTGASGQFEPKTLYVVSSDQINAYNTQIKNVADPEEEKDAANKWYVDSACESVLNIVEESGGGGGDLRNYYKKSETSSSSELSNAFEDALSADAVKIGLSALTAQKSSGIDVRSIAIGKNADASNITYNNAQSIAVGADSSATGEAAVAIGSQAEAIGTSGSSPTGGLNIAIGYRAKAEGKMSIAIGSAAGSASSTNPDSYPYAKGTGSIAIGKNAKALASYDTVVGISATGGPDGGTAGTAFGAYAKASGAGATAIGYAASSSGQQSIAIGRNVQASNIRTVSIGGGQEVSTATEANANYAIALGFGAKAVKQRSIAIGGLSESIIAKANANDAVQIGLGENNVASSLQFLNYQLLDQDGKIPAARLPASQTGISSVSASYIDGHIYLSADQQVVGDIDCTSFAKDGRLSSVELCGTQLVFKLTQDAAVNPLSVELSGLSGIGVTEKWVNDQISDMLTPNNISARLEDNHHICLSAKGVIVGNIDCSPFFDDTRVSNAQLCGTQLVISFNGGVQDISAELSSLPDAWASGAEWIFDCN